MNNDIIDLREPVAESSEVIIDLNEPVERSFEVPRPTTPKRVWQTLRAGLEGLERLDNAGRDEVVRMMRRNQKFGMWGLPGNTALDGLVQFCVLSNRQLNNGIVTKMAAGLSLQQETCDGDRSG